MARIALAAALGVALGYSIGRITFVTGFRPDYRRG